MSFVEYECSLVETARFVLQDGRTFVFAAHEVEPGRFSVEHIPNTPWMTRDDMDLLAELVYLDGLGRIAGRLTRVPRELDA
jgi:hypothetical protein